MQFFRTRFAEIFTDTNYGKRHTKSQAPASLLYKLSVLELIGVKTIFRIFPLDNRVMRLTLYVFDITKTANDFTNMSVSHH